MAKVSLEFNNCEESAAALNTEATTPPAEDSREQIADETSISVTRQNVNEIQANQSQLTIY